MRRLRPGAGGKHVLRVLISALAATTILTSALATAPAVVPAAIPLVSPLVPQSALAASSNITIASSALYELRPEAGTVHVTIDGTATSHTVDTPTRIYYFTSILLPIMPESTNLSATSEGTTVKLTTKSKTATYTVIELPFAGRLLSGKSTAFHLELDLKDAGGSLGRQVRIGTSLAAFPVWAYGTAGTPGSTVSVSIPDGYTVDISDGSLGDPQTSNGRILYQQSAGDASSFFAYVTAARPGGFTDNDFTVPVGDQTATVKVRAWSDDQAWGDEITKLFKTGLPALGSAIGLPYSIKDTLVVEETVSRNIGGFAGIFDPRTNKVEVAYFADSFVVLHETAHVWFNGNLFGERWIDEAFASYYAGQTATKLGIPVDQPKMTASIAAKRIQLNAWQPAGEASVDSDTFAYVATPLLAQEIASRAGSEALTKTWTFASSRYVAYQPAHLADGATPEVATDASAPDWRGLLDLLENGTGRSFEDLWREQVIIPEQVPLMDARTAARTAYAAALTSAGDWNLPPAIRHAMAAWDFTRATPLLADVAPCMAIRADLEKAASDAGLTLPSALQARFETTSDDFAAFRSEAAAEQKVIGAIKEATTASQGDGFFRGIGLIGSEPATNLASAKSALTEDKLDDAYKLAQSATVTWQGAEASGQLRFGVIVVILLAAGGAAAFFMRRRNRIAAVAPVGIEGHSVSVGGPISVEPVPTPALTAPAAPAAEAVDEPVAPDDGITPEGDSPPR